MYPPTGTFTLLHFAASASYTGKSSETLTAPMTVAQLWAGLEERYPGIRAQVLDSATLTVDLEYVDVRDGKVRDETVILAGCEVAIIPPVSSG